MSQIENVLHENRRFQPTAQFQSRARLSNEITYQRMYRESLDDPEGFWGRIAAELPWIERWTKVLDWSGAPVARWFCGGKLNASQVCIDRHLDGPRVQPRPAAQPVKAAADNAFDAVARHFANRVDLRRSGRNHGGHSAGGRMRREPGKR